MSIEYAMHTMTKAVPSSLTPPCITPDLAVNTILAVCPEAAEVMAAYGLHCFSCSVGGVESLSEGCSIHGFDPETTEALIEDLNEAIRSRPAPEPRITITTTAAQEILKIAQQENLQSSGLAVVPDAHGGFCMEFQKEPQHDDYIFPNEEVPEVCVFASPMTLWCVGGAVIDFRDGRFKLDLPNSCECKKENCCKASESS